MPTGDRCCRAPCLIARVLDRFEPDAPAGKRVGVLGAVADRVNDRIARAKALVHDDAVANLEARPLCQLDVRHDADAHEHEIRRKRLAAAHQDRLCFSVRAGNFCHHCPAHHIHAAARVQVAIEL